jgi:hypothetical protein
MRFLSQNLFRAFVIASLGLALAACGDDANPAADCVDAECTTPQAPVCSGDLLIERSSAGTCNESQQCEYATVETDCSTNGGTCVDGQCLGGTELCGGVTCDAPPATECDGNEVVAYSADGTCGESEVCEYSSSRTDCSVGGQICRDGACVDGPQACREAQECDNPPAAFCGEEGALNTYPATGSCEEAVCVYAADAASCETGSTCTDGVCVVDEVEPCEGVTCDTPPPTTCDDGGDVVTFIDVGFCDSETGDCRYAPTRTQCDSGDLCVDGACIADPGPCGGSCSNPPEQPSCDEAGLVVSYAGACNATTTECDYTEVTTPCEDGLSCLSGRCVNPEAPCEGVVCDDEPADDCDGNNVQTWTGSCNPSTALCEYSIASSTACEADLRCDTGACIDRCADTVCEPESDFCADAATAVRYATANICDVETGTCDDSAVRTEVTCAEGSVCDGEGFCRRSWAAGDVVISEWLRDPRQGGTDAEWFELVNTTPETIDLRGLTIKDDGAELFDVTESLELAPGGIAVFARTEGALGEAGTPDFVYGSGMTLSNTEDEIIIMNGELEIAAVRYVTATFRNTKGASNSLDPSSVTPGDYANPDNWCAGFSAYDSQPNRGTPGATNESCSDPCRDLTCPARDAFCLDDSTVATYAAAGVCAEGACDYGDDATITACESTQVCAAGACVSRCAGIICDLEPDFCQDGTTAIVFSDIGVCDELTGDCDSSTVSSVVPCGTGRICVDDGVCRRDWAAGDLLITEFLAGPAQGGSDGEWFEIYNNTGETVELRGLTVRDDGANSFTVDTSVVAAPAERLVFARTATATGAVTPAFVYGTSFTLANTTDQIVIEGASGEIARISYVAGNFGGRTGISASLDPGSTDAAGYNVATNWCDGFTSYDDNGNKGTPGAANAACDSPCRTLDCGVRPASCLNATTALRYSGAGVCDVDAGACDYTDVTTTEICDAGTVCQSGACVIDGASIEAGALVITEVAANFTGNVTNLEWFEVKNTTDQIITLTGLVISDETGATPAQNQSFTVESNVTVAPGEFVVFETVSGAAGTVVSSTYEWGGPTVFRLDLIDQIVLSFDDVQIDRVSWDDLEWPSRDDSAIQFTGADDDNNNDSTLWCFGTNVYAGARFGTPGEANTACDAVGPRSPAPSELVITEVMANSIAGSGDLGEYVEIYHRGSEAVSLNGCVLDDGTANLFPDGITLMPGNYYVIAKSNNATFFGPIVPDVVLTGLGLSNSGDLINIICGSGEDETLVDSFTYQAGSVSVGQALQFELPISASTVTDNDSLANWCVTLAEAPLQYHNNGTNPLFGTPGSANRCTTVPVEPVDTEAWINELHYDNNSTDVNELVEIAGPAGTSLAGWEVQLYNGSNGAVYDTFTITGALSGGTGIGFLTVAVPDIQNGAPDGLALVDAEGTVIQFLSYEGTFTAISGDASGLTSEDIGVTETSSTLTTQSLQLTGSGCAYAEFTWAPPATATPGAANNAQTFACDPP